MFCRRLAAPHVQKLALISVLTVTASHVVAAHISPRPAVHGSTAGPLALASCLLGFGGLQLEFCFIGALLLEFVRWTYTARSVTSC